MNDYIFASIQMKQLYYLKLSVLISIYKAWLARSDKCQSSTWRSDQGKESDSLNMCFHRSILSSDAQKTKVPIYTIRFIVLIRSQSRILRFITMCKSRVNVILM